MTYGSLFSGAGGFDMGLDAAGLSCAWQVEIDKTARSVLARHWPDVPKFNDVRECGKNNLPRVDAIVGGFPCQDLSVAGKRAGLMGGERSGLWWEMLRVIGELQPGVIVFENVPGLRSNDEGRDYPRVVCSLAEHGYFGCVRTLDARNFGVPQSRPRLFGVFARGPDGAERACQILAVRDSLPWHSQAGRQAGAEVAGAITARFGRNGGAANGDVDGNRLVASALTASLGHHGHSSPRGDGTDNLHVYGGNDARGERRGDNQTPAVCVRTNQTGANGCNFKEGESPTISANDQPPAILAGGLVRRFTPRECERLMGWPDDHTRYRADGSEIKDGPRYKMTGNGVVKPVAWWLGMRLKEFA